MIKKQTKCPLCSQSKIGIFQIINKKQYFICSNCDLVFLARQYHLKPKEEKKRYELHENDPQDKAYRKFLTQLANPITRFINPPAVGLDYGCGPGPALAQMLEKKGYNMHIYDPFFADNQEALAKTYDFITSSEVFEHFREPGQEISKIISMVKTKGLIGIMTDLRPQEYMFKNWHYRRDPTHVCFYSDQTFDWISQFYDLERYKISKRVNILRKMK
ncbi:MAG: class I SAM-dependent methyltransferase [Candidatus Marinimicrobia bacterium]|nr:class I SAM-dependent methyltransferase [Candidatus Neomarinimicrobiota bacterium]